MDLAADKKRIGRRSFLGYTIASIGAFITTALGSATALFAASPVFTQRRDARVSLGPVGNFPQGAPKLVEFQVTRKDGWIVEEAAKSAWVVREGEGSFAVFAARCTHLGCAFNWREEQREFFCPCHVGRYALDGQVLGGPPPRPLDRMDYRVEEGKLVIDYKEFRLGITEKVEA
ncbi:MAG: QcrA and Rieske domain-containing protein [Chloroflexota bacterium]